MAKSEHCILESINKSEIQISYKNEMWNFASGVFHLMLWFDTERMWQKFFCPVAGEKVT